ncbi:hypothetical protein BHM03_00045656 [Ensete ventricosum]|uniref:Uncharacterized protein n=1 Tax=Ensete ventricosum TaxID=4639 RepID=A0A445ML11_ENSVE|nr:hypothetical protein BHM03_00045656 [Ensete ventricosum]
MSATTDASGLPAYSTEHAGVWKLPSTAAADTRVLFILPTTLCKLPCAATSKPNLALVPLVPLRATVVFSRTSTWS